MPIIRLPRHFLWTILILSLISLGIASFFSYQYLKNKLAEREALVASQKRDDVTVTIVEGKRREEIAAQLEAAGITQASEFLALTNELEGYLFPDTYRFFPNTPAAEVVATLLTNFEKRTSDLKVTPATIILASIVEREAQNDSERATIAGVYSNRLKRGMKLEADPTVQYARDTATYQSAGQPVQFTFWHSITRQDYQTAPGAYNTYRVVGLPPTPIANPGRASLVAAITPAQHDYLYFVHRDGNLLLSRTLTEHEQQARR